jgi:hypothetical protein
VPQVLKTIKKQEPDRLSVECEAVGTLQRSSTVAGAWRVIAGSDTLLPQIRVAVLNLQKYDGTGSSSSTSSSSNTSGSAGSSSSSTSAAAPATPTAAAARSSTTGSKGKGKRKAKLPAAAAAAAAASAATAVSNGGAANSSEGRRIALWSKKPLEITQELQRLSDGAESSDESSWTTVGKK